VCGRGAGSGFAHSAAFCWVWRGMPAHIQVTHLAPRRSLAPTTQTHSLTHTVPGFTHRAQKGEGEREGESESAPHTHTLARPGAKLNNAPQVYGIKQKFLVLSAREINLLLSDAHKLFSRDTPKWTIVLLQRLFALPWAV
jgi:hypothetical protein